MAKILLIQLQAAPYAGTAYLCGAVRAHGHSFDVLLHTQEDDTSLMQRVREHAPDIIGFSCMTGFHRKALAIAAHIKTVFPVPVIMGGPHATLFPDVINDGALDMICRGEGEFPLVELLNALEQHTSYAAIPNLWVKENGALRKNPLRPLTDPLDQVPLIDWSCYRGTTVQNSSPIAFLIRGCPYSCTYCFNAALRKMYEGKGTYVRHFSVERSCREIQAALDFFDRSPVVFSSDTFGTDLPWMEELFTRYARVTDLPFVVLLRPELVTGKLINLLAKFKCHSVGIGVESGSERVRKEVLNRPYSNALLLRIAHDLHAAGIPFRTYNMLGLPGETRAELDETVTINQSMKTDYPRATVFTPFPGTAIVQKAQSLGLISREFSYDEVPATVFGRSLLTIPHRDYLENLLYFFQSQVAFPLLRPIIRLFIKLPPNTLFRIWFYLVYAYLHRRSENRRLLPYIKYVIANRKAI